ncbi:MAG: hypothetical protein PHC61_09655 [Chitinivibrionales bacterium]|nr:hypothetical protein [Chitinivibrionales bacterium]
MTNFIKIAALCLVGAWSLYAVQLENWRLPYYTRAADLGFNGASPSGMFWDEIVPTPFGNGALWPDSAQYNSNHWILEPALTYSARNDTEYFGGNHFTHFSLLNDIKYKHLLIRQVLDADSRYNADPLYPWNKQRFAAGRIAEAYIQYGWSYGFFRIGKLNRNWGPFPDHSLILSSNPCSYDAFELKIAASFFEFRDLFAVMPYATSGLDANGAPNSRYLAVHSLNFMMGKWGSAGISESVIFSRNTGMPDLQYVNPISIYTVINTNQESDANLMLAFQWNLHPVLQNVALKGQLLIDDIQVDNKGSGDQKPNAWGGDFAGTINKFLPINTPHALSVEYVFLSRWLYTVSDAHTENGQRYTYLDQSLGFPINDGDKFDATFSLMSSNYKAFDIGISYARKGQGRLDSPWKDQSDSSRALGIVPNTLGYRIEPQIPSGIVEGTFDAHLDALVYFKNFIDARVELHNRWIKNKGNVVNPSIKFDPLVSFTLSLHYADFFVPLPR